MAAVKTWEVLDLLNTTAQYFTEKNIENPRLNAEQLLGKILGLRRVDLYVSFERPVTSGELTAYRELVKRRISHEPLQYILGDAEFMGLLFKVTPAALIPRPETEILVEEVLKLKKTIDKPAIIDIGCGSGCIAVSLAHFWPQASIFAADISQEALTLAAENSGLNNVTERVQFIQHDIFADWPAELPEHPDIIVSNPPYIAQDEMPALAKEILDYEPQAALTDGADGMRFYHRLFNLAGERLPAKKGLMFVEMSGSQPEKISGLAKQMNFQDITIINDLTDIPRVLKIEV